MNIIRRTGYFLLPLLILNLNIYASAIDDNCFRFFGFQDKLDQPGGIEHIVNNGWELDIVNQSLRSGLKGESSFSIQEDGPIVISFDYKTSTIEEGVGVFQFLIDGKQQSIKTKMDWNPYQISAIGNGSHELKWIVYKGKNPFVVWIDSLCIKNISIPVPTKYTTATMLNQGPIERNLPPNATNSYYAENDQLFFKNDTEQERNELWNLSLAKNNMGIISKQEQINKNESFINNEEIKRIARTIAKRVIRQTAKEYTEKAIRDYVETVAKEAAESAVKEEIEIASKEAVEKAIDEAADKISKEAIDEIRYLPIGETIENAMENKIKKEVKLAMEEAAEDIAKDAAKKAIIDSCKEAAADVAEIAAKEAAERSTEELVDKLSKEVSEVVARDAVETTIEASVKKAITGEIKKDIEEKITKSIMVAVKQAANDAAKNTVIKFSEKLTVNAARTAILESSEKVAKEVAEKATNKIIKKIFKKAAEKGAVKLSKYAIPGVDIVLFLWDLPGLIDGLECLSDQECVENEILA